MTTRHGLLFLVALAGCNGASDPCTRAISHVASCLGHDIDAPNCDDATAQALLSNDCATIHKATPPGPSDKGEWAALACALGVLNQCPPTSCSASPNVTINSCADYIGLPGCAACEYYACRDAIAQCGPTGYYVGYGEKYCDRFLLTLSPRMSSAGQAFLVAARDCLMEHLETSVPPTEACSDVKADALQSHVACYADNGFCTLSLADRALLLGSIDPADFDLTTALETELDCL